MAGVRRSFERRSPRTRAGERRRATQSIRIISGSLKGRRLEVLGRDSLRPTSERAREALFDILGCEVVGCGFLDLFAGTGAVGLEAYSRGARPVALVEANAEAATMLGDRLDAFGVMRAIHIVESPWPTCLQALRQLGPFRFAFADPPWSLAEWDRILGFLEAPGLMREDGVAILEHPRKADIPESGGPWSVIRTEHYGRTALSFFGRTCPQSSPNLD